jgi:NADPH:quinone reductase-like Zn-dependent oxidoreductase
MEARAPFAYTLCNWRYPRRVITTLSAQDIDFVKRLGAEEAIDYKVSRFEEEVRDMNVVFDAIGDDTFERSWAVLKPGGRMITIAAGSEGTADQRVKRCFLHSRAGKSS